MLVSARLLLVVSASLALIACGPPRDPFADVGGTDSSTRPDTTTSDTPPGEGGAMDGGDARTDARDDAMDSAMCDDTMCDESCVAMGFLLGVCRTNRCECRGGGPDSSTDGRADAIVYESSVRFCHTNADCPPTTFCNGAGCGGTDGGVSFCAPRGEADAATCGTDGPTSCGCDGVLYPNTCARLSAGVRLNPAGTCGGGDAGRTDAMTSGG